MTEKDKLPHVFVVLAYKESKFLEECVKSVLNQTTQTKVVIATSTPNEFISKVAKKYNLPVMVNKKPSGIGGDFDFALHAVPEAELVTIAHQDDVYEPDYAEEVLRYYCKYPKASILITDYFEMRGKKRVYTSRNFKVKRVLISPLRMRSVSGTKFIKRLVLRFGDPICCPAVTFVQKRMPESIFASKLKCNVDWYAWEKLSRRGGKFVLIPKYLMGHRIHTESATTETINENRRTKEDLYMFEKFWPTPVAKFINRFYKSAEKGNEE